MTYVLLLSAPTVSLPKLSEWTGNVTAFSDIRTDRSVLNISNFYRGTNGVDNQQLASQYRQQALDGDAFAQYKSGLAYEHGLGLQKNEKQALNWYQQSANQHFPDAQMRLAYAYYDGSWGCNKICWLPMIGSAK